MSRALKSVLSAKIQSLVLIEMLDFEKYLDFIDCNQNVTDKDVIVFKSKAVNTVLIDVSECNDMQRQMPLSKVKFVSTFWQT